MRGLYNESQMGGAKQKRPEEARALLLGVGATARSLGRALWLYIGG
ncbi:MAG: hypothetical protein ACLPSO_08630 [Terracidiphilus sp.]